MKPDVKKLRELCEKATPGPWVAYPDEDPSGVKTLADIKYDENIVFPYMPYEESGTTEAVFIAEARNQMPALLDYVEKLEKVADAAREYVMGRTIFKDNLGKALAALDQTEQRDVGEK